VIQDGVSELLEASSARLTKSVVDHRSVIATLREESSDESTVISSQTSTLTRNQGDRVIRFALCSIEFHSVAVRCSQTIGTFKK